MAKPVPAQKPAPAAPAPKPAPLAPPPAKAARPGEAFTIERAPGGWVLVTLTYDPATGQALGVRRTEPDLKFITLEKFKLAAFKYWGTIS